jgi:hypothetical protein
VTDETRLDAKVRAALAELPTPTDTRTREALHEVLGRSHSRPPASRWVLPALATACVLAIVVVGSLINWQAPEQPDPAPIRPTRLVGDWQRNVTGAAVPAWDGRWRMRFGSNGVLTLHGPATSTTASDGASYDVQDGRIRVDAFVNSACPELPAGEYAWSQTGGVLTLTLVEDLCRVRTSLMAGTWQPAP